MKSTMAVLISLCITTLAIPARADLYVEDGDFALSSTGFSASWGVGGDAQVAPQTVAGDTFALFTEEAEVSDATTSLTQTIDNLSDTVTYDISFDLSISSEIIPTNESDHFNVLFDGQSIYSWSNTGDEYVAQVQIDEHVAATVTAGSATADLIFEFEADGFRKEILTSVKLDNVSMSVVPVPSAVLLGSFGLGVAGWRLRRKEQ